ncbi:MAG: hypothetical protein D6704_11135 [Nitrospirae bacterium]|nr:MAG: hypothetical protein D6704_11135 [Nitrospirota bacterium]
MNVSIQERFLDWVILTPAWQKGVVYSLLGLFGLGGGWLVLLPLLTDIQGLRHEVSELEVKLRRQSEQLASLEQSLSAPSAQGDLVASDDWRVMSSRQSGDILLQAVTKGADRSGVLLVFWHPGEMSPVQSGSLFQSVITLQVQGQYHQLAQFLDHVLTNVPLLRITTLSFRRDPQAPELIQAEIELVTYHMGSDLPS